MTVEGMTREEMWAQVELRFNEILARDGVAGAARFFRGVADLVSERDDVPEAFVRGATICADCADLVVELEEAAP